jgi:hypothetical protein
MDPQESAAATSVCGSRADLDLLPDGPTIIKGTYREVDVRQKKTPPCRFAGHAAVVLDDGELVFLEPTWSAAAMRPEEERRAWSGRTVLVSGILHHAAPLPEQPVAAIRNPCLSPVAEIRAAT